MTAAPVSRAACHLPAAREERGQKEARAKTQHWGRLQPRSRERIRMRMRRRPKVLCTLPLHPTQQSFRGPSRSRLSRPSAAERPSAGRQPLPRVSSLGPCCRGSRPGALPQLAKAGQQLVPRPSSGRHASTREIIPESPVEATCTTCHVPYTHAWPLLLYVLLLESTVWPSTSCEESVSSDAL